MSETTTNTPAKSAAADLKGSDLKKIQEKLDRAGIPAFDNLEDRLEFALNPQKRATLNPPQLRSDDLKKYRYALDFIPGVGKRADEAASETAFVRRFGFHYFVAIREDVVKDKDGKEKTVKTYELWLRGADQNGMHGFTVGNAFMGNDLSPWTPDNLGFDPKYFVAQRLLKNAGDKDGNFDKKRIEAHLTKLFANV